MWVPKTWNFTEDSSKGFGKSKVSGLGNVQGLPRVSSMLQEVVILPTLFYFPFKGLFG